MAADRPSSAATAQSAISAASTTPSMARAVTAGIVRSSTAGRTGPASSARSARTDDWVCMSWRSIRSRCAVISWFLAPTSGAVSTALIWSSGMARSRSRAQQGGAPEVQPADPVSPRLGDDPGGSG